MRKLQVQTVMPLSMTQQLTMPPASAAHRFCTTLQAVRSSQEQVIFTPPWHFSNFSVHRGTISQLAAGPPAAAPVATPGRPTPGIATPVRSIIIVLDMDPTPFLG
jgi:hypothetical protein